MYISLLYSSKSFNLPSTLYDEPKLLSDRRNACKYHKHIRLYTIKISFKTILFIKTHGSKGNGRGRPRVRVEELLLEAEVGVRVEEEEQQLVRIELSWPCKLDRIARHK